MRLPFGVPKIAPWATRARGMALVALLVPAPARGEVRTITLNDRAQEKAVRLSCTVARTTRVVFPEPSQRLKVSAGAKERLGIRFVAALPRATVEVTPVAAGASGTIEFTGASGVLTLLITAVESEMASDVRLAFPDPPPVSRPEQRAPPAPTRQTPVVARIPPALTPTPPSASPQVRPAATPTPIASVSQLTAGPPSPTPEPTSAQSPQLLSGAGQGPTPTASPSAMVPPLDVSELLQLRPVAIGRREGLPGQRPLILEDALKSDANVWLRFRLVGGSKERVGAISWEHGPLTSFLQAPQGKDLRLIVRLPRPNVNKKTRVRIRLEGEKGDRSFALDSPWLSSFLRSLVR
jgi:hypothetical protein